MTFYDDVEYIDKMHPEQVGIVAAEFLRVARLVASGLPTLDGLRGKVEWSGDARDLYDRRLTEATDLLDALQAGYDKAGQAVEDYAEAQRNAKDLVSQGVTAERRLGGLIADIVGTQSFVVQSSRQMNQWNDLRSTTGVTDWFAELGQGDAIDKIRPQAESLWNEASSLYQRAKRTEEDARSTAADSIRNARRSLPDFLANSANARAVIDGTPGLREEMLQAARDPNARRPGDLVLGLYQVEDDPETRMYPDGVTGWLAEQLGKDPRELRKSEAEILDELGPLDLKKFEEIHDEAFEVADQQFGSPDQNDDHNDAFRHAYWNARLAQEFGEDWALRYATAHEAIPGNVAGREAMDLYNNEIGRSVAKAHPDASPEELARHVREAVDQGQTVVIDQDGNLTYSDQVRPEDTGEPQGMTLPGHPQPEGTDS